jgi:tetratricopeptide (TPR) repeat protein
MLTGNAPFQSENIQYSLKKTLEGKLTSPSQVTAVNVSLEAVCLKALSTSKEQRYSTVLALKQEIDFWLQGFATSAEDATFRKSLWLLLKRHRGISLLIIFILSLSSFFLIKNYYTEKKAYENLQLYIQEKSDKELISKTAAPLLIGLGELALDDGNFSQAKNYANLAVIRDPENMDAWLLKCKVLFFNQEFEACLEICRLHGEETFVKIYQMSKVYSQLKKADSQLLEADDLIELIRSFPNKFGSRMLFDYACQNAPDLNYLIKVSMFYHQEIANPKVKKWLHEIKVVENKVEMNFADHSGMTSLYGLRYLPISKLNISKTPMSKIDNLLKMPLEELDIRFSNIMDPRPILRKRSLKKIYLSKDQTINGNFSSKLARKIIIK